MPRSAPWRRRRRPRWRSAAPSPGPLLAERPGTVQLVSADDARLADGVVVAADVQARLMGVRLLRLRADVLLTPARVRTGSPVVAQPPVVAAALPATHSVALSRAEQLIRDSDALLARARSVSG